MTTIYNNPAEFTDEAVEGFVDLYSDRLRQVVRPQRRNPVDLTALARRQGETVENGAGGEARRVAIDRDGLRVRRPPRGGT